MAISHLCVAIKNADGSYTFKDRRKANKDEEERIEFTLGCHFWKFVDLYRKYNGANRKRVLTEEQEKMLAELDPYWNYQRNKAGERVDPITNKKLDSVAPVDGKLSLSKRVRRNTVFDFDEFCKYALLYKVKYGELSISPDVVAVRLSDGRIDFYDRTVASRSGLKQCYKLGRRMKSIRDSYIRNQSVTKEEMTNAQKMYVLSDAEYQQLADLDPRWLTNTIVDNSHSQLYLTRRQRYPRKTVVSKPVSDEVVNTEDNSIESFERKALKLDEIKNFDFELFYKLCQHQVQIVGDLILSKAQKVAFINDDKLNEEYHLGAVWYVLATTKLFELNDPKFGQVKEPIVKLSLTEGQNQKMEQINKYWFLTPSQRRKCGLNKRNLNKTEKHAEKLEK